MSLSQKQIKDLVFADVTAAEAAGRPGEICYVRSLETFYDYVVAGSAYTVDHTSTLSTGNAGDTRWRARAGKWYPYVKSVVVKVIADDTALTVADGLSHFTVPIELNGMNLVSVGAHVYTVSSSGLPTFQIHNLTDAVDMLSTAITIDAPENASKDAPTPPVNAAPPDDGATGEGIRCDWDVIGTGTKGMEIRMGFRLP